MVLLAGLLSLGPFVVHAAETEQRMPEPPAASAELARVKALAGRWIGTSSGPESEDQPVTAEYRVTSGGSAVVETLFAGTDHEMVSVYHDRSGRLTVTHYCMLGNQPEFALAGGAPNRLELSLAPSSDLNGRRRRICTRSPSRGWIPTT